MIVGLVRIIEDGDKEGEEGMESYSYNAWNHIHIMHGAIHIHMAYYPYLASIPPMRRSTVPTEEPSLSLSSSSS